MKFNLLKIGERFLYKDELYTKSTPLVAINEATGNNKLIPRSALLKPVREPDKPQQAIASGARILQQSGVDFMQGLDEIISLTAEDRIKIQNLYLDITKNIIK